MQAFAPVVPTRRPLSVHRSNRSTLSPEDRPLFADLRARLGVAEPPADDGGSITPENMTGVQFEAVKETGVQSVAEGGSIGASNDFEPPLPRSAQQQAIWHFLKCRQDLNDGVDTGVVSRRMVASKFGMPLESVRTAFKRLRASGLIVWVSSSGGTRDGTGTVYVVPEAAIRAMASDGGSVSRSSSSSYIYKKPTTKKRTLSKPELYAFFEAEIDRRELGKFADPAGCVEIADAPDDKNPSKKLWAALGATGVLDAIQCLGSYAESPAGKGLTNPKAWIRGKLKTFGVACVAGYLKAAEESRPPSKPSRSDSSELLAEPEERLDANLANEVERLMRDEKLSRGDAHLKAQGFEWRA